VIDVDAWIDIDNPPQVQYLLPFKSAFERAGAGVVVTARDHTITLDLLRSHGADFHPVGSAFGARKLDKVRGLLRRSFQLLSLFAELGRPRLLVTASRPAAVVARRLGIPSFVIADYEHADVRVFRLTGSYILHPQVVSPDEFLRRGIRRDRLLPFAGLKEDITFAGVDLASSPGHDFGVGDGLATVLFRPPAEESHYYNEESGALALSLLRCLAERDDSVVVFTPRYQRQSEYLRRYAWRNEPIDLCRPIPFLALLKAVDAVISSGGTMVREAAYLGIPAYSILRSRVGGVDRYLASLGRLTFLASPDECERVRFSRGFRRPPMAANRALLHDLVELMLARTPS
jgi:predicted glycosyltransferase